MLYSNQSGHMQPLTSAPTESSTSGSSMWRYTNEIFRCRKATAPSSSKPLEPATSPQQRQELRACDARHLPHFSLSGKPLLCDVAGCNNYTCQDRAPLFLLSRAAVAVAPRFFAVSPRYPLTQPLCYRYTPSLNRFATWLCDGDGLGSQEGSCYSCHVTRRSRARTGRVAGCEGKCAGRGCASAAACL